MSLAIANQIAIGQGNGSSTTPIVFSPLTVKGGMVRVIDSATGDVARTTAGAIEDIKYKWVFGNAANGASGEFDSSVTRTGRLTLKLSTTDITGKARASTSDQTGSTNATYLWNGVDSNHHPWIFSPVRTDRLRYRSIIFGRIIGFEPTLKEPQSIVLTTNTISAIFLGC